MSKVNRICENCGEPFLAPKGDVNRGYGRCCSRTCSAIVREKFKRGEIDLLEGSRERVDWNHFDDLDYQEDY